MNQTSIVDESPGAALARVVGPLEPSKAAIVRDAFASMFTAVEEWQAEASQLTVTAEGQGGKEKRARLLRLEIREKRVLLDKRRKAMKEGILLEGKAIDGAFHIFEAMAAPLEAHLKEQETFTERAEGARRDALKQARDEALRALGVQSAAMPAALGEMSEEAWSTCLGDAKAAKETRERVAREEEEARVEAARILAERRAEEEKKRKDDEAARLVREQEQAAENERLKSEAVERERAIDEERKKAAENLARAEAERKTQEQATHAALMKADEERKIAERLAAEERVAKENAEAAIRDRDEADRKAKADAETAKIAEEERVANQGARERLVELAARLRDAQLPDGKTNKEREIIDKVRGRLVKLASDIVAAAGAL